MSKTILIISSDHTGHGHKSITESLCEKLKDHNDIKVHVVDGFSLGGKPLLSIGKSYGPITRNAKDLWKLVYNITAHTPSLVDEIIEYAIRDNLLDVIVKTHPDLILSVHANFNGSVINILQKSNINIPFVTLIADLVSIYPLWADPRASAIICPTHEAEEKCLEYGVSPSKIKVIGFPVRSSFVSLNKAVRPFDPSAPLRCLIMSGGEGVGNMRKTAEILLDNFNCTVDIITGRNSSLENKLRGVMEPKYGSRIQIHGFLQNVHDLMLSSDIAFTRGSPNVMMEAAACGLPLVITGALPGQEEGNPRYAEKYNIGIMCSNISDLKSTMDRLLSDNAKMLQVIKKDQSIYMHPDVAGDIADFLIGFNKTPVLSSPEEYSTYNSRKLFLRTFQKIKGIADPIKKADHH